MCSEFQEVFQLCNFIMVNVKPFVVHRVQLPHQSIHMRFYWFAGEFPEYDIDQRHTGHIVALSQLDSTRLHIRDRAHTTIDTNLSQCAHVSKYHVEVSHRDRVDKRSHLSGQIPQPIQSNNDTAQTGLYSIFAFFSLVSIVIEQFKYRFWGKINFILAFGFCAATDKHMSHKRCFTLIDCPKWSIKVKCESVTFIYICTFEI